MITSRTPALDLHGEVVLMVEALVNDFINYHKILKDEYIIIIHGKSTNILTKETHRVLKQNKDVKKFYIDNWNVGQTIVELKL